jgi:hypothetical protein
VTKRRGVILLGAVVGAVALVTIGVLVGARLGGGNDRPVAETTTPAEPVSPDEPSDPTPTATPRPDDDDAVVEFRDEEAGFVMTHPSSWDRLSSSDAQIRLLASPNLRDSVLVRVIPLERPVTTEDMPQLRELTGELVAENEAVQVLLGPEEILLDGAPGFYYLYTFADGGQRGAHSHYFVFEGDRMYVLVFQALPEDTFGELAPVFDRMAESFRFLR